MDNEIDFAEASGKAMAGLLLTNAILGALVMRGIISSKQGLDLIAATKDGASALEPPAVAAMAVAALSGLQISWAKKTN